MSDVVTLRVRCQHCGGPVTLYVSEWREALQKRLDEHGQAPATWECPRCRQPNEGRFPGMLELVVEGHIIDA